MRWNCPHCGTHLAMADNKMTNHWSFSRCFKCAGYALVRKSEVNIIKVDRAPAGEKVILPESSETPVMNEVAMKNLSRYSNHSSSQSTQTALSAAGIGEKSVIKPAARRAGTATQTTFAPSARAGAEIISHNPIETFPADFSSDDITTQLQPFAPASAESAARPLAGPNAPAGASAGKGTPMAYLNGVNNLNAFPDPLPEVPEGANRIRLLPMAIGIAAAFALGSGFYLFIQGQDLLEKSRTATAERATRSSQRNSPYSSAPGISNDEGIATAKAAPAQAVAPQTQTLAQARTDQIKIHANAPAREPQSIQPVPTAPHPVQLSSDNPPLIVQPKVKNTHLRAGPGMVYPVVGNADEKAKYVVTDWNDRWFKVLPQIPTQAQTAQNGAKANEEMSGWIRTDAVTVIPTSTVSE